MKVTKKKTAGKVVTFECTADAGEVDQAFNQAHYDFARQMGIEPDGKTSLEQIAKERLGVDNLDFVTQARAAELLVPRAIAKADMLPAFPPTPQMEAPAQRGKAFTFTMDVTKKPEFELSSYDPVEITVSPLTVPDDEVQAQIDNLVERFTEYRTVDAHPIASGDTCMIAIEAYENGARLEGLCTDGRPFTLGAGYMPDDFEQNITGMQPGDTKKFSFKGPGVDSAGNSCERTVDCTVTIKEVQERSTPEVTDEWVKKTMPMFKGVDDMHEQIRERLADEHRFEYENYKCSMATAEFAKRFTGQIDDEIYEHMQVIVRNNMRDQITRAGMDFDQFVEQQGGEKNFGMMIMLQTRETLVQGFTLDAIFRHEKLTVQDEDMLDVCREMDPQNPQRVVEAMEQMGRKFALVESAQRLRASRWALEHANVTVSEEVAF